MDRKGRGKWRKVATAKRFRNVAALQAGQPISRDGIAFQAQSLRQDALWFGSNVARLLWGWRP
jgi:hypothetical protein